MGNIFICIGILIIAYLGYGNYVNQRATDRLLRSFEELPFEKLNVQSQTEPITSNEMDAYDNTNKIISTSNEDKLIGILEIPSIQLTVPIIEGVGEKELKHAVGHLPESGEIEKEDNNFAIAGHRSWTFGQYFNRLDELSVNDEFTVTTKSHTFTYRVITKRIVKPTDMSVLKPISGKTLLTLITCHPLRSNKQRLIVTSERVITS
ncbi:class D sortase [Paenibacillus eucommiae]|nr:class D sortase [Paenibacillus eucommiae]